MHRRIAAMLALLVCASSPAAAQEGGARRAEEPPPAPAAPVMTAPPELLEAAAPEYPEEAAKQGLEAVVDVRIHVDATGAVTQVDVVTPVGNGFDEAAQAAAMRYRFKPAEFDGKPGPIVIETAIHFTLTVAPVETEPIPTGEPAQATGRLVGVAKERGTRRKLANVAVVVEGTELETLTDDEGRFVFAEVPAGTYKLLAVLAGFDRYDVGIEVVANEETDATIYLRPRGGNPYETTVEGEREKVEVTRRTVDRRQMTSVPGTFGDPLRVIQNLPGMARTPYVLGVLLIRGSGVDDSGVYLDGHEVPLLYHFLGGPSILNPEFLDTIDLYPGGFPSRFGRNIGGIVEVNTRDTKTDGIHGSADVDLLDSSIYLRAPITNKIAVAVAGRRSYIDAILPAVLPEQDAGETLVVVPIYWDYQARVDVQLPEKDTLSVMLFGSDDTLDLLQSDEEATFDLNTHIGFWRLRTLYTTRIAPDLKLTISPAFGRDVASFDGGELSSAYAVQRVISVRERVTGHISKRVRIDTGLDLEYRLNTYQLTLPVADDIPELGEDIDVPPEYFEREVDSYGLGAWFEAAIDVGAGVKLIPGLRVDSYLLAGEPRLGFDPRLVVRWQQDEVQAWKAYAGVFHQAPSAEGFDSEFGNQELLLEYAVHTGVGAERKLSRALSVEGELYYVGRRDQAVFTQDVIQNPDGTIKPIFFASEMIGSTIGMELLLRHEVTRNFFGWASYTLSRSERRRHPDSSTELTNFDQTHNLIVVASYRFDSGWETGIRFRAVSGAPTSGISGGTFDADRGDYDPVIDDFRDEREPFFHQLDVRAEKTWTFDTWSFAAYLDVQNIYNAENPEAQQNDYRFRESAPVRGLPILPTLGVKGTW